MFPSHEASFFAPVRMIIQLVILWTTPVMDRSCRHNCANIVQTSAGPRRTFDAAAELAALPGAEELHQILEQNIDIHKKQEEV